MQEMNAEMLRRVLDYCPASGRFTWRVTLSNRAPAGGNAGTLHRTLGYTYISIGRRMYRAHRLAWLHVTGRWPAADIDHINGVRSDNRLENLREVTRSINQQNLRSSRGETHSGLLGVYRTDKKANPWRASIKCEGRDKHLGNFPSADMAHSAYLHAKRRLHVGCTI